MSADKDVMDWEDDVDMYGGDSSTSAVCWWRGEQSHHGGSSMGVSLLPCARTHTHTQQPLAPHTHTNKHNTQHMNDGGFIL